MKEESLVKGKKKGTTTEEVKGQKQGIRKTPRDTVVQHRGSRRERIKDEGREKERMWKAEGRGRKKEHGHRPQLTRKNKKGGKGVRRDERGKMSMRMGTRRKDGVQVGKTLRRERRQEHTDKGGGRGKTEGRSQLVSR